jgi:dTDP-D-glucose 4,6-dehydratase
MSDRVGRRAQYDFRVHDLADPISWRPDASVDLALRAQATEYVDQRAVQETWSRAGRLRPAP